ncbi:MAG: AAA family ATPase [Gemmatales bacterium]
MPELHSLVPTQPLFPRKWLLRDLLPVAELVLLDGASGVGKSILATSLAAIFSHTAELPQPGSILYLSSPQQQALTTEFLKQQLPNYDTMRGLHYQPESVTEGEPVSNAPNLLAFIEASIKEHKPLLLVIDSLEELLELGAEPDNKMLFDFWNGLRNLAHELFCTILIPRRNGLHENRQYGPFTRYGSDVARFGLTLHWHPINPAQRIMTIAKNQRGPVGQQFKINIDTDGHVAPFPAQPFEHARPSRSPATWVPNQDHIVEEDRRIIQAAEDMLQGGTLPKYELHNFLTRNGYTKSAVHRAMNRAKFPTIMLGEDSAYQHSPAMYQDYLFRKEIALKRLEKQTRTGEAAGATTHADQAAGTNSRPPGRVKTRSVIMKLKRAKLLRPASARMLCP